MTSTTFPQYRRLIGKDHFYRIDAADRFVELQRIGGRWVKYEVHAKAYPEKVRIMEILTHAEGRYGSITEKVWRAALDVISNP